MIIFELHYLDYQFLAQPLHTYTLLSVPSLVFTLSLIDRQVMDVREAITLGQTADWFHLAPAENCSTPQPTVSPKHL